MLKICVETEQRPTSVSFHQRFSFPQDPQSSVTASKLHNGSRRNESNARAQISSLIATARIARPDLQRPFNNNDIFSREPSQRRNPFVSSTASAYPPSDSECLKVDLRRGEEIALQTRSFSSQRFHRRLASSARRNQKHTRHQAAARYHH